ncbi:MAG: MFS transporter, partial [Bacillota bacterium]
MDKDAATEERTLQRNLRFNEYNGIAFTLGFNLFNPFLGIFALKLGAPDSYVALLSSLPAITAVLAMIPSARLVDRFPRKKWLTAWLILISRIFYLIAALLPWLFPGHAALALVITVGLMNIPGAITIVAWQSFIAPVVPGSLRNQAFARRNLLMSAFGLIPLVLAGPLIDSLALPRGYQVAFTLAFLLGVVEMLLLLGIREPDPAERAVAAAEPGTRVLSPAALRLRLLGTIRRYPAYWRYCAAAFFFHITWMMAWPLFTIYNVENLGASNSWIAVINVVNTVASVATYRYWGRLADRIGTIRATALSAAGLAVFPALVAMSTSLPMVTFMNIFVGAFGGALNFLLFNALLEVSPETNRTGYIAVYNTLVNVAAAVSPMIGVALKAALTIQGAFWLTALVRLLGAGAFWWA